MFNLKLKFQSTKTPENFIGKSYRYASGGPSLTGLRTITSYEEEKNKLWNNLGLFVPFDTFISKLKSGEIKIESNVQD